MADAPEEVTDITSICTALNLNIGTLNSRAVESIFAGGAPSQCALPPCRFGSGRRGHPFQDRSDI